MMNLMKKQKKYMKPEREWSKRFKIYLQLIERVAKAGGGRLSKLVKMIFKV
jgi:hypothetical protein